MRNTTVTIPYTYYEKGDYVRTPEGVARVIKDEALVFSRADIIYNKVRVKHKSGCSDNPSNSVREIHNRMLFAITKEEYDEEVNYDNI